VKPVEAVHVANALQAGDVGTGFTPLKTEITMYVGSRKCPWVFISGLGRNLAPGCKVLFFSLGLKTRDRCYDFYNIFAQKFCEKNWRFGHKTKLNFWKSWS
jgi:hypothetical protein